MTTFGNQCKHESYLAVTANNNSHIRETPKSMLSLLLQEIVWSFFYN